MIHYITDVIIIVIPYPGVYEMASIMQHNAENLVDDGWNNLECYLNFCNIFKKLKRFAIIPEWLRVKFFGG